MTNVPLAMRMTEMAKADAPFSRFQAESSAARKAGVCNFMFGNSQEMPLPELVAQLRRFAGLSSEPFNELRNQMLMTNNIVI